MNETNQDKLWELAASRHHGEANESEANELNELLPQSENKEIQKTVSELHPKLKQTAPLQNSSLTRSWDKVAHYIKSKKIRLYYSLTKYAAIALLAFGAGTLLDYNWKAGNDAPPLFAEIKVPLGQMTEMTLYDGTHVWLNSGTTLRYASNFGAQSRHVELEGEAFFKVAHSNNPFKVKVKNNEVEVLGTSFAAEAYPDENFSRITLVEGTVQINDQNGQNLKQLKPNQQIHIPDNTKEKISTRKVSTLFYESWINGQIKFDEERLDDVARRMERWYNVEIRFAGKKAGELRFTGTILKNKPIDQSMQAIGMLLPIKVEHERNLATKDVIIISKQ